MTRTRLAPLATLALSLPAAAQNGAFFRIPGWTQAICISADGTTVAGRAGTSAVLWNLPTSTNTVIGSWTATALSADGSVAAGDDGINVFRWTQSTGAVPIGPTSFGYPSISADGSVIVSTDHDNHAYRWSQATGRQMLAFPSGTTSEKAFGISADGSTIVGSASGPTVGSLPVIWHGISPIVTQPLPPNPDAALTTVNADGTVAFGVHAGESADAIRWTPAAGNQDLGFTAGLPIPTATTAAGDIFIGATFGSQGWVWRVGTTPRLLVDVLRSDFGIDLTGTRLFDPRGMSADGRILVGAGQDSTTNQAFAWVITLPRSIPSPASALPLAALLFAPRRRR